MKVRVEKTDFEEFRKALPAKVFDLVMKDIRNKMAHKSLYSSARMTMRTDKSFFTVTLDDDEPIVSTLKLYHGKSFYDFNFDEESDGTRRIFDLLDMLLNKNDDLFISTNLTIERLFLMNFTFHLVRFLFLYLVFDSPSSGSPVTISFSFYNYHLFLIFTKNCFYHLTLVIR